MLRHVFPENKTLPLDPSFRNGRHSQCHGNLEVVDAPWHETGYSAFGRNFATNLSRHPPEKIRIEPVGSQVNADGSPSAWLMALGLGPSKPIRSEGPDLPNARPIWQKRNSECGSCQIPRGEQIQPRAQNRQWNHHGTGQLPALHYV